MRAVLIAAIFFAFSAHAQQPAAPTASEQAAAEAAFSRLRKIDPVMPEAFTGPDTELFPDQRKGLGSLGEAKTAWARELRLRIERDQFWRHAAETSLQEKLGLATAGARGAFMHLILPTWVEMDRSNTAWLKAEIDRRGAWPRISEVGEAESGMIWLLVQHADADKAFQKRALAMMELLVAAKEVSGSNFAYLWDRVATGEGRPQRYGTQGRCIPGEDRWEPSAIEDRANVDAHRTSAGLGSLAEYMDRINSAKLCRGSSSHPASE